MKIVIDENNWRDYTPDDVVNGLNGFVYVNSTAWTQLTNQIEILGLPMRFHITYYTNVLNTYIGLCL